MVHCGVYSVSPDFVRERDVLRVGTLSREVCVEIDRPLLVCSWRGIARIQVPEDNGFSVLGLDVRRCALVDRAVRRATV